MRVRVCVMTVNSLKSSPTQAPDNRRINTLSLLSLRIKVEDEEHKMKKGRMSGRNTSLNFQKRVRWIGWKKIVSDCMKINQEDKNTHG